MGQTKDRKLRLGHIKYLNSFPLYYGLVKQGLLPGLEVVFGTPAELNRMLSLGELDVSAVSSLAYAFLHRELLLLPDVSISCDGPVKSIYLISKVPVHELEGKKVALTNTSATSQVLLRIILTQKYGVEAEFRYAEPDLWMMLKDAAAGLLIGDEALKAGLNAVKDLFYYDLGQEWKEYCGHSMVFALWAVRADYYSENRVKVEELARALRLAMTYALANLDEVAREAAKGGVFDFPTLKEYFSHLIFDLDVLRRAGFLAYCRRAVDLNLLPELPRMAFIGDE